MDKHQNNFYRMLLTIIEFLIVSMQVLASLPALGRSFVRLQNKVGELEDIEEAKGNISPQEKTKRKRNAKLTLAMLAAKVASALYTYAEDNSKTELMALMDISESKLKKMSDPDLVTNAGVIYNSAAPVGVALAEFGVTVEDIELLHLSINAFKKAIGQVGANTDEEAGPVKTTESVITELRQILKSMDKSVNTLKGSNEAFYNNYYNARKIIDYGNRPSKKSDKTVTPEEPKQ